MWLDSCFGSTVVGIYFLVESIEFLVSEHIMEWSDLSFFCFLFLGCLWSEVMLAELCMNMMVFGQVISDCNKYFVK